MAKLTGAKVMARMLDAYGVSAVFHVPAILRRTMAEIEASTAIKRIRTHGEKPAAYMADGYARATRRPGVCMAQTVGGLNLAAGLRDAYLAKSPVIAMTGFAGGRTAEIADVNLHVAADNYGVIEDVHQSLMHILAQHIRQAHMDEAIIRQRKF